MQGKRKYIQAAAVLAVTFFLMQSAAPPDSASAPALPAATPAVTISTTTPVPSPTRSPTPAPSPSPPPSPTPTLLPTPTPYPTASAAPTATPDPVMAILDAMSDEELLGQMVMLGFIGQESMPKEVADLYARYKVGGVMLFGWNVVSFDQTKQLVGTINTLNPNPALPYLIGIDEEGGIVHRLPWNPSTRSAATMGNRNKPDEVYAQYLRVGKGLRELGINANFAPVLDIAPDPSATFLGNRIFGGNPKRVIPLTNAAIRGTQDAGIVAVGKHFPGHGGTPEDSHEVLPTIEDSLKKLHGYALMPFAAAVETGIDAIMIGHLLVPAVDKKLPASLSKKAITGLLREEMGFKGVVFSDDMRMGGIVSNYNIGEAGVRFIEAGGDVVFVGKHANLQIKVLEALSKALQSGRLKRERLLESAYRIVSLKLRLKAG